MKQCPTCQTTYTDETLVFCLTDGARLTPTAGTDATLSLPSEQTVSFDRNPVRVDIPGSSGPPSVPTYIAPPFQPPTIQTAEPRGSNWAVVGILAALLLIVVLGFAGFAAYVFLKPEPAAEGNSKNVTPSPTIANKPDAGNTAAETDDSQELKEKLANLEKQLEDQQKQKDTDSTGTLPPPLPQTGNAARVNSPRDGFLALRSDPSADAGFRIMKIPHGAVVKVFGCRGYSVVGKTRGRWCQVSYGGQTGWAFDAFLSF